MSPTSKPTKAIEIFISYAREDKALRDELEKHLSIMRRQGLITTWHDREIKIGEEWTGEIDRHLNTAQIILLLVSIDFMTSDYCYSTEMKRALERHEAREARVIPIIIRPVDWEIAPFGKLQVLPKDGKPITSWSNLDEAFFDVVQGLRNIVKELPTWSPSSPPSASSALADTFTEPVSPSFWNVPYPRNSFFTGRKELLKDLYETLTKGKAGLLALTGPAGIGKTQMAVEYAYRYNRNYQAVLWARASSRVALVSDFVAIASLLDLPEKAEQDQNRTISAVRTWLEEHTDWLLILDDVDTMGTLSDFIPSVGKGHVLLTIQGPITGRIAQLFRIGRLSSLESTLLLLRRSNSIASNSLAEAAVDKDRNAVMEIAEILDGFPLAFDLVGAYIKETNCGLVGYLARYWKGREWHSEPTSDYRESVTRVWELTREQLKRTHPEAIELLRFCAFLLPTTIPEEVIAAGFADLVQAHLSWADNHASLGNAIDALVRFSLLHRTSNTAILDIHRLIQTLVKSEMNEDMQREWAERTVQAVNQVFPKVEFSKWERGEQYLAHAQTCADYIKQWNIATPEAMQLLQRVASYLKERGQYMQAESLARLKLDIQEQALGPRHPDVAQSLSDLAEIYYARGKYNQAEPFYQQALAIYRHTSGLKHPNTAQSLNSLATLYREQGKYTEAERFYKQALDIRQQALGSNHPDVAQSLSNLALTYSIQGKYAEAEPLCQQALEIRKRTLGANHPDVATSLNNLATLYINQDRYNEAEPLVNQALEIDKSVYGSNHPNVARDINNLGSVLEAQGDLVAALAHYEQALNINEKTYGPDHPTVADSLNNLAGCYKKLEDLSEAEALYKRALAIDEKVYGPYHLSVAICLNNLASLLQITGRLEEARDLYERALLIVETAYSPSYPDAAKIANNLASLLRMMGNQKKAQALYERALTTALATYGPDNTTVGSILNNLAKLLEEMGDIASAEVYYRQAHQIFLKRLGENHPYVIGTAEKLSNLSTITGDHK